ncbi:hypothetical protein WDD9_006181 [Paenibacillus melissococcoides]|uniref:hypothetical protein n=1 Tax=Paenibacillus TaxID=44249 RepID=UPI001BCB57CF|nr:MULTISPECIES: hypothetical protein [Paenibacillus]CAH8721208.1 hypothetical protein WDD9_006181 [Paenibacillus melissococcoides]CAH8721540.1 hypothetical protein HTL2_006411 [Paenibacillus melissococcoides]
MAADRGFMREPSQLLQGCRPGEGEPDSVHGRSAAAPRLAVGGSKPHRTVERICRQSESGAERGRVKRQPELGTLKRHEQPGGGITGEDGGDGEVNSMEISAATTNNRMENGREIEFRDIRTIQNTPLQVSQPFSIIYLNFLVNSYKIFFFLTGNRHIELEMVTILSIFKQMVGWFPVSGSIYN